MCFRKLISRRGWRVEPSERSVITRITDPPQGFEAAGYGRIVRFQTPQTLHSLVTAVQTQLQLHKGISLAVPQSVKLNDRHKIKISSVGICAGSGGSLLNGLDVDLLFTGELSHHEALAATENGKCIITTFHSNSERGFLQHRLAIELLGALKRQNEAVVYVSEVDRDPYEIAGISDASLW